MFEICKNLLFIRNTKFLYLSFFLFASAIGVNLVTFPSILKLHKIEPFLIGIACAIELLGVAFMSFFLSRFVARFGIIKAIKFACIIYSSIILIIYFYNNFIMWLLLVFVLGCCWLTFVITRFSWFNSFLNNEERGVGLGIFSALISLGVATGPVIVKFSGAQNYLSFIISALLVCGAWISLYPLRNLTPPKINSQRISLRKFFKNNPNSFLSRFFLDFITYAIVTLAVVFGTNIGFSNESSGLLITAYMASGFFDIFVGFMLKKISPQKLINIGYLGCFYSFLIVNFYHDSFYFLLLCFFVFGLFIACVYVSVFKIINEDYKNTELISANSTSQLIGTIGSLTGSLFGGAMINIFPTQGLPIAILSACLCYLIFLVIYEKSKK